MKQISHILCFAVLFFISIGAHAYSCSESISSISGLDDVTKQKMVTDCEAAKLNAVQSTSGPNVSQITPEKIDAWGDVAKKFIGAIGLVAKELNQSVNDFIKTPAGILASTLIVWHVMGDDIMEMVSGIALILIGLGIIAGTKRYVRYMLLTGHEQKTVKRFGMEKIVTVPIYTTPSDLDSNSESNFYVCYVIGCILGIIFILVGVL